MLWAICCQDAHDRSGPAGDNNNPPSEVEYAITMAVAEVALWPVFVTNMTLGNEPVGLVRYLGYLEYLALPATGLFWGFTIELFFIQIPRQWLSKLRG
jgi:hypothetical protein